jgi:putative hydrolase of the HAD superfamily
MRAQGIREVHDARVRVVLLDALGTLLRLEPPAPRLRALLLERHGIEVAEADAGRAVRAEIGFYRANLHRGSDAAGLASLRADCAAIVQRELGIEQDVHDALLEAIVFTPFPEVPGTLRRLRALGLRLVVASNWDVSLHEALERTGLRELVDGAVSSAEAGTAKPAPEVFERALALAGAAPSEALHVGDDLAADVGGARGAGIEPVLVVRDGGPAPDGVAVVRSLDELLPIVESTA